EATSRLTDHVRHGADRLERLGPGTGSQAVAGSRIRRSPRQAGRAANAADRARNITACTMRYSSPKITTRVPALDVSGGRRTMSTPRRPLNRLVSLTAACASYVLLAAPVMAQEAEVPPEGRDTLFSDDEVKAA